MSVSPWARREIGPRFSSLYGKAVIPDDNGQVIALGTDGGLKCSDPSKSQYLCPESFWLVSLQIEHQQRQSGLTHGLRSKSAPASSLVAQLIVDRPEVLMAVCNLYKTFWVQLLQY